MGTVTSPPAYVLHRPSRTPRPPTKPAPRGVSSSHPLCVLAGEGTHACGQRQVVSGQSGLDAELREGGLIRMGARGSQGPGGFLTCFLLDDTQYS